MVQGFLMAAASIVVIRLLIFLAFAGHRDTQRMQDMHLLLSVTSGEDAEIAPAGHFCAHRPQEVQPESALGTSPASWHL